MMRKIRYMIEIIEILFTIIYTNHSTTISISRQINFFTFNTNKLNLKLIRIFQYLSNFNLAVKHKSEKFNIIFDVLSKLSDTNIIIETNDRIKILKTFYKTFIDVCHDDLFVIITIFSLSKQTFVYYIILIKMTDDFKQKLKQVYIKNHYWSKIFIMFKTNQTFKINQTIIQMNDSFNSTIIQINDIINQMNENIIQKNEAVDINLENIFKNDFKTKIRFKHQNDLIYYIIENGRERLCVSNFMKQKIFIMIHDFIHHDDFHRIYDRIASSIYIRHLFKHFCIYIVHCSNCQLNQIKKHSVYNELISMITSAISFHIITMNFIIVLSKNKKKYNMLLTIICKFSKRILLISNKNTWDAVKWTKVIIKTFVEHDWNISRAIINDRDFKFMFEFWNAIFIMMKVSMFMFIAYYLQTDEQSKRIN